MNVFKRYWLFLSSQYSYLFKRMKWYVYANIISVLFKSYIKDEIDGYIEYNIQEIMSDQAEAYNTGIQEAYD